MYKYINKNSEDFKKRIWKAFNNNRLRLMRFNELNLLTAQDEVGKLFLKIQQMYQDFFDNALEEFDLPKDFLAKHLDEFNPTMMYAFLNEMERKQSRYADSIWGLSQEDKRLTYSLNHWKAMNNMTATAGNVSRQIIEEAIDLERYATLDAWAEEGVEEVMWVTAGDEKVCEECGPLDGKVFKIDEVPERPHWNCRCELVKFIGEKKDSIDEKLDNSGPKKYPITDNGISKIRQSKIKSFTDDLKQKIQSNSKLLLSDSKFNNDANEVAYTLDKNGLFVEKIYGTSEKVDLGNLLNKTSPYILHNHPNNGSYSYGDISYFLKNDSVEYLAVIYNNGSLEELFKTSEYDKIKASTELYRALKKYKALELHDDLLYDKAIKEFLKNKKTGLEWRTDYD